MLKANDSRVRTGPMPLNEGAMDKYIIDSAIALIAGHAAQLRDIKEDPAAVNALADWLDGLMEVIATHTRPSDVERDA